MSEALVKLEMTTVIEPPVEGASIEKWRASAKEDILKELVSLLSAQNRIGNETKLLIDFVNRERKATTGIGKGIAIPHIRSLQAKEFMIAFARSAGGYDFDALDHQPTHMFFVMASPPYDDSMYLKAFKALAEMAQYETFRADLMAARSAGEILRTIRAME